MDPTVGERDVKEEGSYITPSAALQLPIASNLIYQLMAVACLCLLLTYALVKQKNCILIV